MLLLSIAIQTAGLFNQVLKSNVLRVAQFAVPFAY